MYADNGKTYYNKEWLKAREIYELPDRERSEVIVNLLSQWRPDEQGRRLKIIDVGCGVGWTSQFLFPYGEVVGVDFSETAIEIAQTRYPDAQFHCIDILDDRMRGLNTFDLALASEIIEHIPKEKKAEFVRKLSLLVRPGGVLIITTPNRLVWNLYWKNPSSLASKQPIEDWQTPKELKKLLSHEFECLQITTFGFKFTHEGIHRLLNSGRLNALAEAFRLSSLMSSIKAKRYGLYIAAVFRRLEPTAGQR